MQQKKRENNLLLGEQLEDRLIEFIWSKPVKIGEKIPNEFDLAEKFGVGRSTVREAVKGLVSKGVLEIRRGDGTYVINTHSTKEDPLGIGKLNDKFKVALDLCDVRLMLEPEIAAMAAENATKEDKEQLQQLCEEVENLYNNGRNHLNKDVEFHTCIAKCSKNSVVEMLIPVIDSAVITFGNLTHRTLQKETIETHRTITNAIISGDTLGAKCAMVMHLTYNRQKILEMEHNI